ncbi:hypothetical protein [Streptomyces sp. TRM64462]|uniref:hypothetical protein n=1 Tax=Streptomyces sp. TRM64462 TaxID=2741726 RepID=UPI001C309A37|nr:hypothetical protein [Streptomyces sp. TRM64462]
MSRRLLASTAAAAFAISAVLAAGAAGAAGAAWGVPADIAVAGREPSCGDTSAAAFPIRTRIVGGPDVYRAGGGALSWRVELTNTTGRACHNIHPVIVLTDQGGELTPADVRMEFADREGAAGRAVRVEATDHDEVVGVLDDDTDRAFAGFTVPAGGTVAVPVRLAFAGGARVGAVTANAAVVQRRGDDGEWVGESGDYRFVVARAVGESEAAEPEPEQLAGTGRRGAGVLVPLGAAAGGCVAVGAAVVVLARRAGG